MRSFASLLLTLTLAACDSPDFAAPDLVTKDRVLAGRVVIEDDPARATPAPGETARYELLVGGPGVEASWTSLLVVCRIARDENGVAHCDPSQQLSPPSSEPQVSRWPTLPSVSFTVPALEELREDERELVVEGIVCPDCPFDAALLTALAAGDYTALASGRNPCADKSKNGVVIASPFAIERNEDARNHAPVIESVFWSKLTDDRQDVIAGTPWTQEAPVDAPAESCATLGLPMLGRRDRLGIQIALAPEARETYSDPSAIPGAAPETRTEIPRVQGLSSRGKFEIVRDNQQELGQLLQLEWILPKQAKVPPGGLLVRFWFLASDDRFGDTRATSWQARALCVEDQEH